MCEGGYRAGEVSPHIVPGRYLSGAIVTAFNAGETFPRPQGVHRIYFFLLFVRVSLLLQPEQRSVTKSYVHFSTPGGIRFPQRLGRNEVAVGGCEADFAKAFATQGVGEATPKTLLHVFCSVTRETAESTYTSIGGCRGGKTGRCRKNKYV